MKTISIILAFVASVAAQGTFGDLVSCRLDASFGTVYITDRALCNGARGNPVAGQCCVRSFEEAGAYRRLCGERVDQASGRRAYVEVVKSETRC
ncbi:uncharacterized protein CTRU02_214881 [Colletotrichum truncatum]|uniref:Uncharacterized protein n=1 Tax=Colletotrichum truncatum TaxID=5467 RepID=A0ACC3YE41_COLTU|nr:uncharacterized protein CTRU02_08365 [Colletotrichum truncatum]KAF6790236.1 hypothetical protein CTRU02_08365 [Colletotrichum truncatum]